MKKGFFPISQILLIFPRYGETYLQINLFGDDDDPYNFPARKEENCRNPQVKW